MAMLWAESFDYYDTTLVNGQTNMLQGLWAQFTGGSDGEAEVTTEEARTGTHSLKMDYAGGTPSELRARRTIPLSLNFGVANAWRFPALPGNLSRSGVEFQTQAGTAILSCGVQSDGSIAVKAGALDTASSIGVSSQAITAGAWHHVEIKINIDNIVGSIEIKVDGSTVLNLINQNFGTVAIASIAWGRTGNSGSGAGSGVTFYVDDIVAWDTTGTSNNDFIGLMRVLTQYANTDTAQTDWVRNTGANDYEMIDDTAPDDDTTYISGAAVSDQSEFDMSDLPPEVVALAGVFIPSRMRLDSSGAGQVQVSMRSSASVADGADRQITAVYSYWPDVFEVDPATSSAWTRTAFNAALLRLTKTA